MESKLTVTSLLLLAITTEVEMQFFGFYPAFQPIIQSLPNTVTHRNVTRKHHRYEVIFTEDDDSGEENDKGNDHFGYPPRLYQENNHDHSYYEVTTKKNPFSYVFDDTERRNKKTTPKAVVITTEKPIRRHDSSHTTSKPRPNVNRNINKNNNADVSKDADDVTDFWNFNTHQKEKRKQISSETSSKNLFGVNTVRPSFKSTTKSTSNPHQGSKYVNNQNNYNSDSYWSNYNTQRPSSSSRPAHYTQTTTRPVFSDELPNIFDERPTYNSHTTAKPNFQITNSNHKPEHNTENNGQSPEYNNQRPNHSIQKPDQNNRRPDYTQRPSHSTQRPAFNNQRPNNNQKPDTHRPSNSERPDTQRPNNNQRPDYNTQRPSNNQRPDYNTQRPSNNQKPDYNTQRPDYNTQRPNNNKRPDYNNHRPDDNEHATQNPYKPGVKPPAFHGPPITNKPIAQKPSTERPFIHHYPRPDTITFPEKDNGIPELVIGPDEDTMTDAEKRRYAELAERMCDSYKALDVSQVAAIPLLPAPEPVKVNVSACGPAGTPLIVGGKVVDIRQFPYNAALGWLQLQEGGYAWKCGGSLISKQFVLTAAHCAYQDRDNTVSTGPPQVVQLGSSYLNDPGALVVRVARAIRHPRYKPPRSYHDIALLKLTLAVTFSEVIRPACLGAPPPPGQPVIVTGWGRTEFDGATSQELRGVSLPVWDIAECGRVLGTSRRLPDGPRADTQMCAGEVDGGKDTCQGDSGGGAARRDGCAWRVVAVTSLGRACAAPRTPAIYAVPSAPHLMRAMADHTT